jgi:uncharacterized protein
MAYDVFIQIPGMDGESTDDHHRGWIEVTQFDFNVRQKVSQTASSAGGASAERADFSEFGFTNLMDKTSPLLALACAGGTHFDSIVVELCRAGGDKIRLYGFIRPNQFRKRLQRIFRHDFHLSRKVQKDHEQVPQGAGQVSCLDGFLSKDRSYFHGSLPAWRQMIMKQRDILTGNFETKRYAMILRAIGTRLLVSGAGLLILFFGPPILLALEVPASHGRVNDNARMLSPQTRVSLDGVLAELERTDSTQVVVLTVASLQGDNLEDFADRVFQGWGIGQESLDNGVLLLIAEKERKIRIEVGYGLESRLTDLKAGRIIGNVIAPAFRAGRFDRGVIEGVSTITATIRGEYRAWDKPTNMPVEDSLITRCLIGIAVCLILLIVLLKENLFSAAAACGAIAPGAGVLFFDLTVIQILGLAAVGFCAGLLLTLARRIFKPKNRFRAYRVFWDDSDWGGGSSSGSGTSGSSGSSSDGGASGGGSGGGGASGGW